MEITFPICFSINEIDFEILEYLSPKFEPIEKYTKDDFKI